MREDRVRCCGDAVSVVGLVRPALPRREGVIRGGPDRFQVQLNHDTSRTQSFRNFCRIAAH